jgi:hypothetical protein
MTGCIARNANQGASSFAGAVEIYFATRQLEAGVVPYLFSVLVDKALDKWMGGFNVDFAGAKDVGSDGEHVAEIVDDVKNIVTKA